ncbi:MAG: ABC transporter substrate-binding protein [Thermodesulfobacteriota bacterium]|nr:ABC transporter substrate-binding protein [Thermodesulfobacteriota bacterium]
MLIMKKFSVMAMFFLLFSISASHLSAEPLPSGPAVDAIEALNATLLDCMKRGDELGYSGRYGLLEPVMKKYFFFSYMVRKSSGSYWKELGINQQQQLLEKYITWSVGTYAQRFKKYKGQQFMVVSSGSVRGKYMMVISHLIKTDKEVREFKYILLESNGAWLIVDIQIEGISQLSLTRAQFKSVLKAQGIDGLLKVLDEKISKLD